jgi:dTDP-4-dehydrorhamnose reductase
MQKILLIGGNGQLGTEIQKSLINYPNLVTVSRPQINLYEPEKLRDLVLEIQPEIVINAAAYTAVDLAEKEPELAKLGNAIAPQYLAQACEKLGAYLMHISTDYVFDGTGNQPYPEDYPTNPLSTYGKTKLAGEIAIQSHCQNYIIIRTAWVYGSYGKANFVKTMLRLGKDREVVKVVYDQVGSPTWAADLAGVIKQILPQLTPEMTGIYHYTNSGVCSWYDFAVAIFAEARQLNFPLQIQEVIPITTPEYPTPAHRPPYSVLATTKIRSYLDSYHPYWRESLVKMLKEFQTL